MIDLKLFDETVARLRRVAEQNQATASSRLEMVADQYKVPGKPPRLIVGDQEFIFKLLIPAGEIPADAVLIPRIDVDQRMEDARAGTFNTEEEE